MTNTFVAGDIGSLNLTETDTAIDGDENGATNSYVIVPGVGIKKDPTITFTFDTANVNGVNRPAYVFVTVSDDAWTYDVDTKTFSSNAIDTVIAANAMTWTVDTNWTYLTSDENNYVFYKLVDPAELTADKVDPAGQFKASIIAEDTINVDEEIITEENIEALASAVSGLTFKGYAIQQETFEDAQEAWAALK